MANIYSEKTADWTYHNVTRLDIHSFRFSGIGAYATTTIVGEEMGQELSGEISFRGFISPIQNSLSQGLRCRLDIYSKQDPEQLEWEIESHFVYIKGDRNGVISQKVSVRSGAYDHIDLRLEVLLDAELSLDDTIDLTSFVVHDAGFIGELNIIKDKIEKSETGLSALEQETLNLFNVISGSMGFYPTVVEQEDGKFISYVHDKPKLEDSMVIAVMTEEGWASTITGWNDGEPDWSYGVTFGGSLVMNVVSAVGVNADWVRAGELIGGKVHFDLDEGTFLIGDSDEDYQLYFDGTDLKLGGNTTISWGNVTNQPSILDSDDVTTITNSTIKTTNVIAANLTVKAANIDGTLSASQINTTGLITQYISDTPAMTGGYGKIGYGTAGGAGVEFNLGDSRYLLNMWHDGKVALFINDVQRMGLYENGRSFIADHAGRIMQEFSATGEIYIRGPNGKLRLYVGGDYTQMYDKDGKVRFQINTDNRFYIFNNDNKVRFGLSELDVPYMRIDSGHEVGVDSDGAYYKQGSTKTYLKNMGEVRSGTVEISTTANATVSKYVSFGTSFSSAPQVVACLAGTVPTRFQGPSVQNISTSGFDVYIRDTTTGTAYVRWIAVL